MTTMPTLHFVCDRCGHYWRASRAAQCPECNAGRVWEFDRAQPARDHSAHVKRIFASRLFREVLHEV
jgi:DNA-directed RNA polymerase subunit M/transcription elongation factor TFIIS